MKRILILYLTLFGHALFAQQKESELPKVFINADVTTHFVFSEPITFVDISTNEIVGDQPTPNVLRIKPIIEEGGEPDMNAFNGIVTIIGQKYMVQYALVYTSSDRADKNVTIARGDGIGLVNPEITMSVPEMKEFALQVLKKKGTYFSVKSTSSRVSAQLNNIFTIGDYFFMDLTFKNHTNIKYDIDQIRFKIEDKHKTRRTNFQQIEIQAEYALYDQPSFKKRYRNIFVFKKFTFPNEKIFTIELAEEQISGRTLILEIDYSDVLNADTI